MRNWPSQVRIVHGEISAKRELGERIKAHYRQAQRNLEPLIPSVWNDARLKAPACEHMNVGKAVSRKRPRDGVGSKKVGNIFENGFVWRSSRSQHNRHLATQINVASTAKNPSYPSRRLARLKQILQPVQSSQLHTGVNGRSADAAPICLLPI